MRPGSVLRAESWSPGGKTALVPESPPSRNAMNISQSSVLKSVHIVPHFRTHAHRAQDMRAQLSKRGLVPHGTRVGRNMLRWVKVTFSERTGWQLSIWIGQQLEGITSPLSISFSSASKKAAVIRFQGMGVFLCCLGVIRKLYRFLILLERLDN